MKALLLSDTHVPQRARQLPDAVWHAIDEAELVIHAGDWNGLELYQEVIERADLLGVHGNNDGPDLRAVLPEVATRTIEGVRVAVVHDSGDAVGRELRADARFPDVDLLVFGHSHIPWDSTTPGGMRLLNPGSPTDRRRQPHATMLWVDFEDGAIVATELVEL